MPLPSEKGPTVALPFAWFTTVYHRAATEKRPGLVVGFHVCPGVTMVIVTWGEDCEDTRHYPEELTVSFTPDYY